MQQILDGVIVAYKPDRQYGFIRSEDGGIFFFYVTVCRGTPRSNARCQFIPSDEPIEAGKKFPRATDVLVLP